MALYGSDIENRKEDNKTVYTRESRSQKKRNSCAVQDLGLEVAELPKKTQLKLEVSPELKKALLDLPKIPTFEGKRRQTQYIGVLMREEDHEYIDTFLKEHSTKYSLNHKRFMSLEILRTMLIDGDADVLQELISLCPKLDHKLLRQLIRNAQKETTQKKAAKAIFQMIQAIPTEEVNAIIAKKNQKISKTKSTESTEEPESTEVAEVAESTESS